MTTLSTHVPTSTPRAAVKTDVADYEPDEEWKRSMRKRIEEGLESMVKEVKDNQQAELRRGVISQDRRLRMEEEYKAAMSSIKALATEQYQAELHRERNQRRWLAGVPMNAEWTRILAEEQQSIMNTIKHTSSSDDRPPTESPTEDRRPLQFTRPSPVAAPPEPVRSTRSVSNQVPPTPKPTLNSTDKPATTPPEPPPSARRGSDARGTMSWDREDRTASIRREPSVTKGRPSLPEHWGAPDAGEESEELLRPPQSSRPKQPLEQPSSSPETSRWESSLSRNGSMRAPYTARSPPKALPEVWKPSTTPSDDPPPPAPPILPPSNKSNNNLGRRGSSASMRSTGSGSSGRPTIAETIPERADDGEGSSDSALAEDYDQPRPKHADKERRGARKNSRPTPVDPNLYSDEPPPPPPMSSTTTTTTLRSAIPPSSSLVMQLAKSPAPTRSLSTKPSFPNCDSDRYRDPPPATAPLRERDPPYPYRDPLYSARDPPHSARPPPSRASYGEEREYGPYQTPSRASKTPFRDYPPSLAPPSHPVTHKSSFNYEDRRRERDREPERDRERDREHSWDDERDFGRERDYDHRDRDWDRDRDRDREWERERDRERDLYREPRYPNHYPPYSARSPGYPTPPSSAARHTSQDYVHMNEIYDSHDGPPPPRNYGYRSDDREHPRSESARPIMTRQNSYSRRDEPDRDPYSRGYPPATSIPIPPRHQPSHEDLPLGPGWKDWGTTEGRRPNDSRYDNYARSPPAQEHFPIRRRSTNYNNDTSTRDDPLPIQNGRTKRRPPQLDGGDDRHNFDDHDQDYDRNRDRPYDDRRRKANSQSSDDDSGEEDGHEREAQAKKLEEERRETDERIKEQAAEILRLQEEEKRLEEEARRKEEEVRLKEEEVQRKEEEAERVAEELRRKDEETTRKAEEAKRKEQEARRKEKEAQKREQEAKRKADDAKRIVSEARQKAEEASKKEEEARRKEEEINRKEELSKRKEEKLREDVERTRKLQQEANRITEEARRKQESLKRLEEETKRKELEIEERERVLQLREEDLRIREEEARRLEEEAWRKEEDARKKEADARRKEQEARRKEEEVRRKEEEARRKEEEARRKEEEARRKEEEAKRKEESIKRKEEEARRKEEEARRKEEEARKKQEEALRKEEEIRRKEEEARVKEEEAKRKDEIRRKEEESRRRAEEAMKREEERKREEEAEARSREDKFRREQEARRFQETERFLDEPYDAKFLEEQNRLLQQAEFRKREEEIRRRAEERKRQDSVGHENAWAPPPPQTNPPRTYNQFASTQPQHNGPQYSAPSPSPSGNSAAWTSWGTASSKPTTVPTPASARSSTSTIPPPVNKPRAGSVSGGSYPSGASPQSSTPFSESEWARRHAEFTNDQQERFRREQERLEAERQMRAAGKPLSRDDIQRLFEHHDRLWSRLPAMSDLTWQDFPWPVLRPPSSADDITFPFVNAYFQSPFSSDKEKFKSAKDRIKDHLRRWHPDRFDSKVLPRVVESEKDKVKQGAGSVVRYLNDLLRKENENGSAPNLFGE